MSRLKLSSSNSALGSVASAAALESLTEIGFIARFRADVFRTFVGNKDFWRMSNKSNSSAGCYSDGSTFTIKVNDSLNFSQESSGLSVSILPANGNDVVLYVWRGTAAITWALGVPDGTQITSGTFSGGSLATGTGTGLLELLSAQQTNEYGMEWDAFAVLTAARTGDARFAKPLTTDSDVLRVWGFTEGTGTTATDAKASAVMTLTGPTWLTGGVWDAFGSGGGGISPAVLRRRLSTLY